MKTYDIPKLKPFGAPVEYAFITRNGIKKSMRMEDKREPCLEDTDKIWFGKYNGQPLSDVPASYLKWLWSEEGANHAAYSGYKITPTLQHGTIQKIKLANYIWNCQDHLAQELGESFI